MKITLICFSCDSCYHESTPENNVARARETARIAGWDLTNAKHHYCFACKYDQTIYGEAML